MTKCDFELCEIFVEKTCPDWAQTWDGRHVCVSVCDADHVTSPLLCRYPEMAAVSRSDVVGSCLLQRRVRRNGVLNLRFRSMCDLQYVEGARRGTISYTRKPASRQMAAPSFRGDGGALNLISRTSYLPKWCICL